jgi:hypothetical protein
MSRYAGGSNFVSRRAMPAASNFVSLDFVSDALPLPESEQR